MLVVCLKNVVLFVSIPIFAFLSFPPSDIGCSGCARSPRAHAFPRSAAATMPNTRWRGRLCMLLILLVVLALELQLALVPRADAAVSDPCSAASDCPPFSRTL
jgi:hypothetical protein